MSKKKRHSRLLDYADLQITLARTHKRDAFCVLNGERGGNLLFQIQFMGQNAPAGKEIDKIQGKTPQAHGAQSQHDG